MLGDHANQRSNVDGRKYRTMDDISTESRFFLEILDSRIKAIAAEGNFALAIQGAKFMISYAPTALVGHNRLRIIHEMQEASCGGSKTLIPANDGPTGCSNSPTDSSMLTGITSHSSEKPKVQNASVFNGVQSTTKKFMILPRPHLSEKDVTKFKGAIIDASLAVGVQPKLPRSYIELGYLYELQSYVLHAYEIYTSGLASVSKTDPAYWQLSLASKEAKRRLGIRINFIKRLPVDLLDAIFCNLGEKDRRTCLNVSKDWRTMIFKSPKTWSSVTFKKRTFNNASALFTRKVQDIKEIQFCGISNNQVKRVACKIVYPLKNINSLILEECRVSPSQLIDISLKTTRHLTLLSVSFPPGAEPMHVNFVLHIFPHLRYFSYTLDDSTEWPMSSTIAHLRKSLQLESLSIICATLKMDDLRAILKRCNKLKCLCVDRIFEIFPIPKSVQNLTINRRDVIGVSNSLGSDQHFSQSITGCRRLAMDNCSLSIEQLRLHMHTLETLSICFTEAQALDSLAILGSFHSEQLAHLALSNVLTNSSGTFAALIRRSPNINSIEFKKTEVLKKQIIVAAIMSLRNLRFFTAEDVALEPNIFRQFLDRPEVKARISSISFRNVSGFCDDSLALIGHMNSLECAVLENIKPTTDKPFPALLLNFQRTGEMRRLEIAGFKTLGDEFLKYLSCVRGVRIFKIAGADSLTNAGVDRFLQNTEYSLKRVDFINCGSINRTVRR